MTNQQQHEAESLHTFIEQVNKEGSELMQYFDKAIEKAQSIKKLTNYCKHKLKDPGLNTVSKVGKAVTTELNGAVGYNFEGIPGTLFFPPAMAARVLKTNTQTIMSLTDSGQLFGLVLHGAFYIPEKAIEIYQKTILIK